jgi:hypothetical protein
MQSPLRDATQSAPSVVPHKQVERSSVSVTTVVRKAATATTQPLSLPEDVVTLSSSHDGSSPKMKASQPVSNEEKKALLKIKSPRGSFSVYG